MVRGGCIGNGDWSLGYHRVYTYSQAKPTPLPPVLPQLADVDAAAVANYKGGSSEEEEDTKEKEDIPTISQPPVQLPEESPLNLLRPSTSHSTSQGGAFGSMDTDASAMKRPEEFDDQSRAKMPRIEEAPITEPPSKLPRIEVRMVHDVEATLTEEIGLEEDGVCIPTTWMRMTW